MNKWLSRHVIVNGKDRGLSIVTILNDDIKITTFEQEEAGTVYTDKVISINTRSLPPTILFLDSNSESHEN